MVLLKSCHLKRRLFGLESYLTSFEFQRSESLVHRLLFLIALEKILINPVTSTRHLSRPFSLDFLSQASLTHLIVSQPLNFCPR